MSGRHTRGRSIVERETTFVFRGWQAGELARAAGVKVVFNGVAGGHVGDRDRLPDLLAALEHRRVAVAVHRFRPAEGNEVSSSSTPRPGEVAVVDDVFAEQPDLFGGDVA